MLFASQAFSPFAIDPHVSKTVAPPVRRRLEVVLVELPLTYKPLYLWKNLMKKNDRIFALEQSLAALQRQYNEMYDAKEFWRLLAAARLVQIEELESEQEDRQT